VTRHDDKDTEEVFGRERVNRGLRPQSAHEARRRLFKRQRHLRRAILSPQNLRGLTVDAMLGFAMARPRVEKSSSLSLRPRHPYKCLLQKVERFKTPGD
jgi:hypothetical protein